MLSRKSSAFFSLRGLKFLQKLAVHFVKFVEKDQEGSELMEKFDQGLSRLVEVMSPSPLRSVVVSGPPGIMEYDTFLPRTRQTYPGILSMTVLES